MVINQNKITNFGYGGISCPCCTPLNTKKKNKAYSKRRYRKYLKKEQDFEEGEYFNYWTDPNAREWDDIFNWDDDWQLYEWEEQNLKYYHNYMEGRDTVEHSSVYSKNTYEW